MIYESLLLYQIQSPASPEIISEPGHLVATLTFAISPRDMEHSKLKKIKDSQKQACNNHKHLCIYLTVAQFCMAPCQQENRHRFIQIYKINIKKTFSYLL